MKGLPVLAARWDLLLPTIPHRHDMAVRLLEEIARLQFAQDVLIAGAAG